MIWGDGWGGTRTQNPNTNLQRALRPVPRYIPNMKTTTHEIADGVFRFSTAVDGVGPAPFTFNQFLIRADEPLLFHTGMKALFPLVSEAVARIVPLDSLRWITFGHNEADDEHHAEPRMDPAGRRPAAE